MATSFDSIFKRFLIRVPDDWLHDLCLESRELILQEYLDTAESYVYPVVLSADGTDLSVKEEDGSGYTADLNPNLLEIMVLGMAWASVNSRLNSRETTSNYLNSKDRYLAGSPAVLLRELRYAERDRWNDFQNALNSYSFRVSDFENRTPDSVRGT